ncbi:phage head closure protein [Heyndrickxia oleronia]|uniref:phage head closure protein n=1 Tax=Heyndrickxia oleronia TaxID=38875 RepID=UPI00071736EE|nr:phage head closure protein [Heyndrickxia oleronia]MBU5214488.1 phage head closure protein [Heyndrickxia oleronia]
MRFDSVIDLIQVTYTEDEIGNQIEDTEKRQTFAEKKSVRQSEFYQASMAGLKPEITFVLWVHEYKGEPKLEYEGKTYTIIRTYERTDKTIELTCEVKTGG